MSAKIHSIIIDCKNPNELSSFYAQILDWKPLPDSWCGLISPNGERVEFQLDEGYIRPEWPSKPGSQGQMIHLDYYVDDLQQSAAQAQKLGATVSPTQFYEEYQCITMFDPEGHPFCLLQNPGSASAEE